MRKNTMIGLGAALLVIVSTFFPMISGNELVEELSSLWSGADEDNQTVATIILVLAGLMGLFSFLANKKHLFSIGTLIMSGLLMLISMKWSRDIGDSAGMFSYGMGLILFLVGSGLGLVSSILGFMKK
jgi:hypothetical protein